MGDKESVWIEKKNRKKEEGLKILGWTGLRLDGNWYGLLIVAF